MYPFQRSWCYMNVECQMHNSNLSLSLYFTNTKILIEVNHFIISSLLSPDTGELQSPSFSMVLVLGFYVFLVVCAGLKVLRGSQRLV